ncbi:MAG: hypothetical protein HN720_12555, partial [Nitrospinaceae bacterium]|nr:hypothetical protein [Nitrospinaceae bacterium]
SNESRIRYIMNSAGVPHSGAEDIVAKSNRDQGLFSQFFFRVDFADPKLYHAVFNIDQISSDDICEMVPSMIAEISEKPVLGA